MTRNSDNEDQDVITIYTDGACSGNPGPGGWGAILIAGAHRKELKGGASNTTNNKMELFAAISALEALKRSSRVALHTDSTYVMRGISEWIHNWKRRGWKTAAKKPVKNVELWQRLDEARAAAMTCPGTGSKAMPAIPKTSAQMNWHARGWPNMRIIWMEMGCRLTCETLEPRL